MAWADATAYSEAVQNPRLAFRDAELHDGELATNRLGLPLIHSGNFAAVFQMRPDVKQKVPPIYFWR
jgi:hypothetical protein